MIRIPRPILLTRPNRRQYGHFALELLFSFLEAREKRADLFIVHDPAGLGEGLLALDTPDVRVLRPGPLAAAALKALWRWITLREALAAWPVATAYAMRDDLSTELRRHIRSAYVRRRTRSLLRRARKRLHSI